MDPEAKQRQLFAVLRRLVQGADPRAAPRASRRSSRTSTGSIPAARSFLEQWVDAIAGASSFLLLNFRPEYHAAWMQKSYYRQLPLAPLGPEAIRELLDDLLGSDPSTRGLAEAIHARTGGNPFFTEEVVQTLIESGKPPGHARELSAGHADRPRSTCPPRCRPCSRRASIGCRSARSRCCRRRR